MNIREQSLLRALAGVSGTVSVVTPLELSINKVLYSVMRELVCPHHNSPQFPLWWAWAVCHLVTLMEQNYVRLLMACGWMLENRDFKASY